MINFPRPVSNLYKLVTERELYHLDWGLFWQENRSLILPTAVIFIIVLLWRSWPNFLVPSLHVEDTKYFNYFYGDYRGLAGLFFNPNDYHNILNNLVALLIAKLDVRWQPQFYLWIGALTAMCTVLVLSFSGLLRNGYVLVAAPFLLGLSGLNDLLYYVSLTYQIYVLVILLLAILFCQSPTTWYGTTILFSCLSLLIWSGPYSVLVVPFSACFILLFRGKSWFLAGLSIVAILYTMSVTGSMVVYQNLWNPYILKLWGHTLVEQVFYMGLAGPPNAERVSLVVGLFFLLLVVLRKDSFFLKVSLILLVLINANLAVLFLSKKFMLYHTIRPCYLLISQLFWLFFLLFSADRLLGIEKDWYHYGAVVCFAAMLFITHDNITRPWKYRAPVRQELGAFLQDVREAEHEYRENPARERYMILGNSPFRPEIKVGGHE